MKRMNTVLLAYVVAIVVECCTLYLHVGRVQAQSPEEIGSKYLRPSGDPADCSTCRFLGSHMIVQFDKFRSVRGKHEFGILATLTGGTTIYAGVFNKLQTAANGKTRMVVECNNNGHAEMTVSDDINPNAPDPDKSFALSVEMTVGSACKLNNGCNELRAKWQCRYERPSVTAPPIVIPHPMAESEYPFSLQTEHVIHGVTSNDNSTQNNFDVRFVENAAHTMGPIDGLNGAPFVPYNRIDKGTYGNPVAPRCQPVCDGSLVQGWTATDNYHPFFGINATGSAGPGMRMKLYGSSPNSGEFRVCMNEGLPGSPCQPTPTPSPTSTATPTATPICQTGHASLLNGVLPLCQESGAWCWAASSQFVIAKVKNVTYSQCQIDEWGYDHSPGQCDQSEGGWFTHITRALDQGGLTVDHRFGQGRLTPQVVQTEIDAGHPIMVGIRFKKRLINGGTPWPGPSPVEGWHSLIITGYECVNGGELLVEWISTKRCGSGTTQYSYSKAKLSELLNNTGFTVFDSHVVH